MVQKEANLRQVIGTGFSMSVQVCLCLFIHSSMQQMIIFVRAFSVSLTVLDSSDTRDRTSLITTLELIYHESP